MNIIKQIREMRNFSQAQLAERLGVSTQSVWLWEKSEKLTKRTLLQLEGAGFIEIEIIPEQVNIRVTTGEKK